MADDLYDVLGVSRGASSDDIQRAYRKLARKYHPDVSSEPGAEEKFKELSEAYSVLTDPEDRSRYDRFGPNFRQYRDIPDGARGPAATAGRGAGGWAAREQGAGPDGWGPGGPGPGFGGGPRVRVSGDIDDAAWQDLIGEWFSGRGPGGPITGSDQEADLDLTVEEAYRGGRRTIQLAGGQDRTYEVTIPPGVVDGQRIRLSGQGAQGVGAGPAGDLYLIARIRPHPRYRLSGRDITVTLPVSPWEAALGATVPVETPGGPVKVQVPAGTPSGRRLRLRGQGMPNPRGAPGDLFAEVRIVVPSRLGPRERELFEELAAVSDFDPREST